jgi:hypothetical protein
LFHWPLVAEKSEFDDESHAERHKKRIEGDEGSNGATDEKQRASLMPQSRTTKSITMSRTLRGNDTLHGIMLCSNELFTKSLTLISVHEDQAVSRRHDLSFLCDSICQVLLGVPMKS